VHSVESRERTMIDETRAPKALTGAKKRRSGGASGSSSCWRRCAHSPGKHCTLAHPHERVAVQRASSGLAHFSGPARLIFRWPVYTRGPRIAVSPRKPTARVFGLERMAASQIREPATKKVLS
jgi:hypothetical protein